MSMRIGRREFLLKAGAIAGAITASPGINALAHESEAGAMDPPASDRQAAPAPSAGTPTLTSPFQAYILNHEHQQDFGRACDVASREFGMKRIELRGMWQK